MKKTHHYVFELELNVQHLIYHGGFPFDNIQEIAYRVHELVRELIPTATEDEFQISVTPRSYAKRRN